MFKIKNNKFLYVLLLIFMGLMMISGCGKSNEKNSESESQSKIESSEDNSQSESENESEKIEDDSEEGKEESTEVIKSEYTYTKIEQIMYTTAAINVRNVPSVDGEKIGSLPTGKEVQVTGQCNETGWYRIDYNEMVAYVSNDYLNTELPSSWVSKLDIAQTVSQMIVVTAEQMGISDVTVSMHTKDANGIWVEDYSTAGKIGRNGLGKEKEGDGKTPIGVFTFTKAFGILENPGLVTMPYLQVDETHHWVDDPTSKYYNQCVSTRDVTSDWNSTEHLYKYVGDYNYSLATSYNEECIPYVGCAIFLHCTNSVFGPTSGCIAVPEAYMRQTMINLKSDCVIVIDLSSEIEKY